MAIAAMRQRTRMALKVLGFIGFCLATDRSPGRPSAPGKVLPADSTAYNRSKRPAMPGFRGLQEISSPGLAVCSRPSLKEDLADAPLPSEDSSYVLPGPAAPGRPCPGHPFPRELPRPPGGGGPQAGALAQGGRVPAPAGRGLGPDLHRVSGQVHAGQRHDGRGADLGGEPEEPRPLPRDRPPARPPGRPLRGGGPYPRGPGQDHRPGDLLDPLDRGGLDPDGHGIRPRRGHHPRPGPALVARRRHPAPHALHQPGRAGDGDRLVQQVRRHPL